MFSTCTSTFLSRLSNRFTLCVGSSSPSLRFWGVPPFFPFTLIHLFPSPSFLLFSSNLSFPLPLALIGFILLFFTPPSSFLLIPLSTLTFPLFNHSVYFPLAPRHCRIRSYKCAMLVYSASMPSSEGAGVGIQLCSYSIHTEVQIQSSAVQWLINLYSYAFFFFLTCYNTSKTN